MAEAPPSLAPFGLDRPVRVAIHTGRDKDRATKTLLFGRADTAKKGVYAMRAGESAVVLIPDETWAAVPKNVAVLRDKAVVEVDRDKVTRIEIESPKGAVTLAQEKGRWKITAPERCRPTRSRRAPCCSSSASSGRRPSSPTTPPGSRATWRSLRCA